MLSTVQLLRSGMRTLPQRREKGRRCFLMKKASVHGSISWPDVFPKALHIEAELFRDTFRGNTILQFHNRQEFVHTLDGDMPFALQAKLLRFLDQWTVRAVGSASEETVDMQVVSATNSSLEQAVTDRRFSVRSDGTGQRYQWPILSAIRADHRYCHLNFGI